MVVYRVLKTIEVRHVREIERVILHRDEIERYCVSSGITFRITEKLVTHIHLLLRF